VIRFKSDGKRPSEDSEVTQFKTVEQMQDQIKRQREALKKIAGYFNNWLRADECREVARAALQPKEGEG
jgi:hypothetical protein